MSLEMNTLGRFQLLVDGRDVTTQLDASRTFLLTYLADTARPQPRDHLAELLWPERPNGRARSNLRTLLTRLRPLLADYLQVTAEWVALQPLSLIQLDAHVFATQLALARQASPTVARQAFATAMHYYRGDFLATYAGVWNAEMESWLTARRLALHGQAVQSLRQLLTAADDLDPTAATSYARQLLELEPLDEAACRQLMSLLAQQGQRDEALWHYQRYQHALREAWATATPSEELVMLAAKIRLGLPHSRSAVAMPPVLVGGAAPAAPHESREQAPNAKAAVAQFHFPAPLKPLVGRKQERAQIGQWLDWGYRLISVTGLGGVGKSHFVQTVIAAQQERWRHGALYVPLAPATTGAPPAQLTLQERQQMAVAALARAVAAPLSITLQPNQDYGEQLQAALSGYACCLVLDNFEQILPAAAYLQSLLARAGQVTVIAISRLRLGLAAEVNLTLTGLPLAPVLNQGGRESRSSPADPKVDEPASGTALALLTHNLTRHLPGFQPTAADRVALQQICRAVHGLPLALELAPVLARRLPLTEVAARLTAEPLTLSADFADLPEQQRSLYTVLDAMFTAASPAVQEALVRLSVFAGPFTAADAVCLVKSPLLAEIKQQSWLETVAPEQLTLHPLVAAFVRGLCVDQKWAMIYAQARRAHAGYYAKLVDGQHFFQNPHYTAGMIWLRQHFAEITTACQTFLAETPEAAVPLLHVITMYGHHFGDQQTVHQWLRQGLDKLPKTLPARFRLLLDYVACTTELFNMTAANAALAEARTYAADQQDQAALLSLYERLAWAAHSDYAADSPHWRQEGRQYFSQGLALAETMGDQAQVVNMLAHRAFLACWDPAGYPQAQADLQQALTIAHQLGQPGVLGIVYKILAYVEFVADHLALAKRYSERGMQLLAAEGGMLVTLGWLYMERSQIALAQRDTPTARHYLTLASEIFHPVSYEAGLMQYHTLLGIVAFLEENPDEAERYWLRAYRSVQQMNGQDKPTVTLTLGIGVTQLIQGDPMLGAQLVAAARVQYAEKAFHWVPPEQRLMTYLIERAETAREALALPVVVAIDAQVATQALMLLAAMN